MPLTPRRRLQVLRRPVPLFTLALLLAPCSQPSSGVQILSKTSLQRAVVPGRPLGVSEGSGPPSSHPSSIAGSGSRMHPLGFPFLTYGNEGFKPRTLNMSPALIIPLQPEHNGRSASPLGISPLYLGGMRSGVTWTFLRARPGREDGQQLRGSCPRGFSNLGLMLLFRPRGQASFVWPSNFLGLQSPGNRRIFLRPTNLGRTVDPRRICVRTRLLSRVPCCF